jgi:antitoxin YefM
VSASGGRYLPQMNTAETPTREPATGSHVRPPGPDPKTDNSSKVHRPSTDSKDRMRTMTYSEPRAKYAETLNAVVDDREEVISTRAGHEPVVMVSLDDYESLKEAAYLLRSPANARRRLASIDRLEAGKGVERAIAE